MQVLQAPVGIIFALVLAQSLDITLGALSGTMPGLEMYAARAAAKKVMFAYTGAGNHGLP